MVGGFVVCLNRDLTASKMSGFKAWAIYNSSFGIYCVDTYFLCPVRGYLFVAFKHKTLLRRRCYPNKY